ncbi:DUF881 domain-containing protein [Cellulosimicrobium sp. NPDC057127]|uniref:DUF881 domain-containing protein n=1 Tax=Cellulosimicrobium sp. NPDC057127 TaxID=3346026 RepID=UPI003631CA89
MTRTPAAPPPEPEDTSGTARETPADAPSASAPEPAGVAHDTDPPAPAQDAAPGEDAPAAHGTDALARTDTAPGTDSDPEQRDPEEGEPAEGDPADGEARTTSTGAVRTGEPEPQAPVSDTSPDRSSDDVHQHDVPPDGDLDESGPGGATGTDEPAGEQTPSRPAVPHGRHGAPTLPEPGGLRALGRALRPRAQRSQIVVGVLCALLGFALVVQVTQTQEDQLSSLRQTDLVRLLDDVTQRSGELEDQVASLRATRDELRSGSGRERAALEVAREQQQTQGILSGRLPAQGPGVQIEVVEGSAPLDGFLLFNVLEELRNAGAEAMEVNGVRLVASSYFEDTGDGVVVDGQTIVSPYRWTVIGDPSTLETALEIPGGAMASLRSDGARTSISRHDEVAVTATREPSAPEYATPVPATQ